MAESDTETTTTSSASLIEKVSFEKLFFGLTQHGYSLSEAEKKKLEEICRDEVKKQNGGQLLGGNIGGGAVNLVQLLLSFIQQLLGIGEGNLPSTLAGLGEQLRGAAGGAIDSGKQYVLNIINANIYERLQAEGGNLAASADIITGVSSGPEHARDNLLEQQFITAQNIPEGTSSNLNRVADVADASAGHGLPPAAKGSLTQAKLGA